MNREVTFKETVELFLTNIIYDIKNETETPRINFLFNKNAYDLFYEVMNNPLKLKGWKPNITEKDILELKNIINHDYPTIFIKDHIKFFTYLTEITNNLIKLYNNYNENKVSRTLHIQILRRIWLRMSHNDFNNVELFLKRQLIFIKTDIFENLKFKGFNQKNIVDTFNNHYINATNSINRTWDESTKCMTFKIETDSIEHTLPNIFYDISNDTCYIYAIQNEIFANKNKEIEREIYKLYRGNNQPNKVFALKLFIKLLKENNIKYLKVPTLQVLNNRYHELLSKKTIENFNRKWTKEVLNNLSKYELENLKKDKIWYNHIVNNEHNISKLKTEDFIKLFYRIVEEDKSLYILNEIDIDDTLTIKIKKPNK